MAGHFQSPFYNVTTQGGSKLTIDVTNSISAGLDPNSGLVGHLIPWMKERGFSRVLDFGAGALRHTIPLLKKGIEVVSVEYERAYQRPKAAEARADAAKLDGFTALLWPHDFLKSKHRFDVALLLYVLQVVPIKADRKKILEAIGQRFDGNGPKRLYYASRYGDTTGLKDEMKYNDGWVKGIGEKDRSFYTEWNAHSTNELFQSHGYERVGGYSGASQGFIYDYKPGML
jgi:hypothetical protein